MQKTINTGHLMSQFQDFFDKVDRAKGGDGLAYAKSIAPKGMQCIVAVETVENGKANGRLSPDPVKHGAPVCLNAKGATLEQLRNNGSLMSHVLAGHLKLMTTAEVNAWFRAKAEATGIPLEELTSNSPSLSHVIQKDPIIVKVDINTDVVDPRIAHLCDRASSSDPNLRPPEPEMMSEIFDMQDALGELELNLLITKGFYPEVIKFAKKLQASRKEQK